MLFRSLAKALNAQAIKTTVRYLPNATHGFLIRREALIGLEKQQSDQAWREIYQFLAQALKQLNQSSSITNGTKNMSPPAIPNKHAKNPSAP